MKKEVLEKAKTYTQRICFPEYSVPEVVLISDTSGIQVETPDVTYQLKGSWQKSFKQVANINGDGLNELSSENFCKVINTLLHTSKKEKKKTKLTVFNEVTDTGIKEVCYAGLSEGYKILPVYDLITTLFDALEKTFENFEIVSYEFHPEYSIVDISLKNSKLDEKYAEHLGNKNSKFILRFQTSDAGWSATTLIPMICERNYKLYVADPLAIEHRGKNASLEAFSENCNNIYALAQEGINNLYRLKQKEISHPVACFFNLCQKLHIGESVINNSSLRGTLSRVNQSGNSVTALQLYRWIGQIMTIPASSRSKSVAETLAAEKQKSVLNISDATWKQLDRATSKYKLEEVV